MVPQDRNEPRGIVPIHQRIAMSIKDKVDDAALLKLVRCEAVAGDFFEAVPQGGDLYVLKFILVDWKDAEALRILQSCRTAITPDGKLLVIEMTIPDTNDPSPGVLFDLNMLVMTGGQALYWPRQDFVSTALFRRARRFTCWRPSQSDLRWPARMRPTGTFALTSALEGKSGPDMLGSSSSLRNPNRTSTRGRSTAPNWGISAGSSHP